MKAIGITFLLLGILLTGGNSMVAKDKEEFKVAKIHVTADTVQTGFNDNNQCEDRHCTGDVDPSYARVYSFFLIKEDGTSVQLQSVLGSSLHGMFKTVSDYEVTYRERTHFFGQLKNTHYVYVVLNGKQGQFYYEDLVDPGQKRPEKTR